MSSPYTLISSNYGLPATCEDLYRHLRSASSLDDVLGRHFEWINIQRLGPLDSHSDPFLLTLVEALSHHPSITNMFLSGLSWGDFGSPIRWHLTITAFPNITSLELEAVSLGGIELFSLIRAFPKLTELTLDEVKLTSTNIFAVHANIQAFDAQTIRNNQHGPEISSFSISVGEGTTNTLDPFIRINSPVSFRRLETLAIEGTGGEDVIRQIATLIDIAEPCDLSVNCVLVSEYAGHTARPPPLNLASVHSLEVMIPLNGEYDFEHTNDCLRWWASMFKQVPEINNLTDICIMVDVAPKTFLLLPTGGKALSWIIFDEILSDQKFKLTEFSVVPRPLDFSDIAFNMRFYDEWLKSEVLVQCFEHHQGLSLRWDP
ncbi:uncharacterized protein BT62DRAFT_922693 [Guyanagaster necrorhizus]|uniref:Uncharacterized protein n=1 Tax=Guyanagaster necrorhizus TaxID=856835 RepID=A0A9P7VLT2_9AGAR|nr:uncharacterized protein BT62DRAFT_922693 [Guyanagaster necrorhizus MCA 3950]KAG7442259.1 hypothetical protein BT62DRAFT_922693 [Guyanagaster necrorhizus MCA 3950]